MLVPKDFEVPVLLETDRYRIRPISVHDVVRDYDAVMTSVERLRGIFGPESSWPPPDLSFTQDLVDLGWHHKEFQRRSSFAYVVMNLEETSQLGCVYVYPSSRSGWDAEVHLWVRDLPDADELDADLYRTVTGWVTEAWPFEKVAFPGRSIDWAEWMNR